MGFWKKLQCKYLKPDAFVLDLAECIKNNTYDELKVSPDYSAPDDVCGQYSLNIILSFKIKDLYINARMSEHTIYLSNAIDIMSQYFIQDKALIRSNNISTEDLKGDNLKYLYNIVCIYALPHIHQQKEKNNTEKLEQLKTLYT